MAKRSIEDYRPRGIDLEARYVSDDLLDRLVGVAGSLPDRPFVIPAIGPNSAGEWIDQEVPARRYLRYVLEMAATAYHYRSDDSRKPTASQLVDAFTGIEQRAKQLLQLLRVEGGENGPSIENMPVALRYGALRDAAMKDAKLREAKSGQFCSPDTLMREAIKGVASLQRWAGLAKGSENDPKRPGEGVRGEKGFKGDTALNAFLKTVAVDCWQGACGQGSAVGPKLVTFVFLASESISVRLGDDDAVLKRIQRLLDSQ